MGDAAWKEAQTKGRESAGLSFSLFLKAEIGTVEVKGIRTTGCAVSPVNRGQSGALIRDLSSL